MRCRDAELTWEMGAVGGSNPNGDMIAFFWLVTGNGRRDALYRCSADLCPRIGELGWDGSGDVLHTLSFFWVTGL